MFNSIPETHYMKKDVLELLDHRCPLCGNLLLSSTHWYTDKPKAIKHCSVCGNHPNELYFIRKKQGIPTEAGRITRV